ncbi:MAG: alcohol dehydrogenase family protein [Actinomycetota bacterium]
MREEIPETMAAVYLRGYGGEEQLDYVTDAPVPSPGPDEVLIRVRAAGVNNTDINTRIGWYAREITTGSTDTADAADEQEAASGWNGDIEFPRIQGADACGHIVAVGDGVDPARIGERVIVASLQDAYSDDPFGCITWGSEKDGGFAQYTVAHTTETFAVDCDWTDVELASMPCAYSTAEGMLHRVDVGAERVLITGASGGVGSAAVQLAKRRGAEVVAVASASKAEAVRALGPDEVVDRDTDLLDRFGERSFDVIVDVVAGPFFAQATQLLKTGGRYITAGAIAGPVVELDVRDLYLKDLTLKGSTYQPPEVFPNLVGYIERGEIRPVIAATYPLADIVEAQQAFLDKGFVGKIVLVHPE